MGNYSWLITTRNQPENCEIDWSAMNTNLLYRHWLLEECHKEAEDVRPHTLEQMAKRWHDTKFCGYFDEDYIKSLQEFCLHLKPYGSYPRLYYDYEGFEQLWCLEFIPGTTTVNYSVYSYRKEMATAPIYPKELEKCEKYTDEIMNLEQDYNDSLQEFLDEMQPTLPEKPGWKFQRLVHVPMTDAEALMSIYRMIHPQD